MIWGIIIFVVVFILKLFRDIWLWKKDKKNKHTIGPAIVAATIVFCTIITGWLSLPMWLFGWWALFDPCYALGIGKHPSYIGTTAKLDKLQHRYPVLVWIKYIGCVLSIILYIYAN